MKIATWNVNSLKVRLPQVLAWLQENDIDLLAMQEIKLVDEKFPHTQFQAAGYHSICHGQKTYNGVAIIARPPVQDSIRNIPGLNDEQARVITATVPGPQGPLRIINTYFVNGQAPGSEKFTYKLRWLAALTEFVRQQMQQHENLIILGDFNVTPDDRDTFDPDGLRGTIHHTEEERQHFRGLLDLGLTDAFRHFEQGDKFYSWWDYRMLAFQKNRGMRIDHILVSAPLKNRMVQCHIDRTPRKNPQPSDHTPVVLTLN